MAGLGLLLDPCEGLNAQIHTRVDLTVGYILDDEYSVTHVAAKVAWYIPCMKWSSRGVG